MTCVEVLNSLRGYFCSTLHATRGFRCCHILGYDAVQSVPTVLTGPIHPENCNFFFSGEIPTFGACSADGGGERRVQGFGRET
jgi:hypothetical protein